MVDVETPIRWGIAGTARISETVVEDLARSGAGAPVAVFSRSRANADAFAARHGIPLATDSFDELIDSPSVEAVHIATPFTTHVELALAAMRAGKHVLVEKPVATRAADVELLFEEAHRLGRFCMEAMWFRFNPAVRRMMELVASGAIGEVRSVRAAFGIPMPVEHFPGRWDADRSPGSLFDQGIYPVTLAHLTLGAPDSISVRGTMASPPIDTAAHYDLDYDNGRFAQLASSMVEFTDLSASVAGTAGWIRLTGIFWATEGLEVHAGDSNRIFRQPEVLPFPADGHGYAPMLVAASEAIRAGLVEHPEHGRDTTVAVARTLHAIHARIGASSRPS